MNLVLQQNLKTGILMSLASLFKYWLFRSIQEFVVVPPTYVFWCSFFSIYVKNVIRIVIRIVLDLQTALDVI